MIQRLFILLLLGLAMPARAITSLEALHLGTPREGFSGQADLSLSGRSGNSDTADLSLGSRLQWHHEGVINYLLLTAAYGESNGLRDTEKWFLHGRHIERIHNGLDWEAFAQGGGDRFARLSFRGLLGGGARIQLGNRAGRQAILGLGGYYSQERLRDDGYPDTRSDIFWRGNAYLVLKTALGDNATLVSTTYYQPALDDWSDFRLLEQAGLKVAINRSLALKINLDINHDSRPPQGVKKTDTSFTTSLSYAF